MSPPRESLDAPDGSALTWIFDHCLRYPGSYEMPLRTMYTLNCNPAKQPLPGNRSPETAFTPRNSTSTKSSRSSQDTSSVDAAADFRAQLIHQISRLPSQPCSLPPSFVTSFLRRCFTPKLENVDFPQVLTALDYLKDLENRWKKEMAAALQRLNIGPEDARRPTHSDLARKYPGVVAWLESLNAKGRRVEALYTQIYIGLRRWNLINEMLLEPYNKANCMAMLNTLFPPVSDSTPTPTPQLTPQILKSQRDGIFRYISAMEVRGKRVLDPVIAQGAPEGQSTSWPLVHDALEKYLVLANEIIDECVLVNEPAHLEEGDPQHPNHKGRKADSGISFGSSGTDNSASEDVTDKPLPQFPVPKNGEGKVGGSALERLAREIRKLGDGAKSKNPRKMKSTSALNARPDSQQSHAESSFFEIDEQKRRRLIGEATIRKNSQSHGSSLLSR